MRRLSLRARILAIALTLLTVGMVVSDAVVLVALRKPLVERVDLQVTIGAGALSLVPEPVLRALSADAPVARRGTPNDFYLAYLTPDGRTSLSLHGSSVPELPILDRAAVAARRGEVFEVPGWRVLAVPTRSGGSVVVAGALSQVDETMKQVLLLCVLVGAGLLVVLAGAGWFWVRAGLRPLRSIEETAAAIAGGDLSRRVPFTTSPATEVGRLTAALNGMLTQIEGAVAARTRSEERLRRFVADASHELRTPLAGISGFAQLYRMGGAEIDATMDRIERESQRLTGLVDDLLLLAQLDERGLELRRAPMDLRTLAADALHDLRALDPTRGVQLTGLAVADSSTSASTVMGSLTSTPATKGDPTLKPAVASDPTSTPAALHAPTPTPTTAGGPAPRPAATGSPAAEPVMAGEPVRALVDENPAPAPVVGDESRLRQVVSNLVGNVIAHTPAGSAVRVGVGTSGGDAVLEIADSGPGLPAEQVRPVFERFYRADTSRARDHGGGAGLGLAIVWSLVTAHGGTVELDTAPGEGATFRLRLPAASP